MTLLEFTTANESLLGVMEGNAITPKALKWLRVHRTFITLRRQGYKVAYCEGKTAEAHGLTPRQVRQIENKLTKNLKI